MQLDAVVFDLDGVVRHYDRAEEAAIERRHGLEAGSLLITAFGSPAGQDLMCGRIDHDEFALRVGELVGSHDAALDLVATRATVDDRAVELVLALQDVVRVALLTNGSLRTPTELADAGLDRVFDHIFNSAVIGVAKPTAAVYHHVLEVLDVSADRALFVDDHLPNIDGARGVGMHTHHFSDLDELVVHLETFGLSV